MIQASGSDDPFFLVGPDANPSLVVNQISQNVGIKTANPQHELDIQEQFVQPTCENFRLSDLPNAPSEESTFKRNRVLKVNNQGDGCNWS